MLTADTYITVLPQVACKAAEDIAALIITAGCQVPGTQRRRQPYCPFTVDPSASEKQA